VELSTGFDASPIPPDPRFVAQTSMKFGADAINYYKRHLGDYAKNTRTLTTYEHGVYNLVLDLYYTDEKPVTTEDAYAICRAESAKDRAHVDRVLVKFFRPEGDAWRHERADEEIAKYLEKSEKNKAIGSLGGKQKAKRNASETLGESPEECLANDTPSHKPVVKQEQELPATPGAPQPVEPDPIFGVGLDFLKRKGVPEKSARSFLGLLRKELHDDLTVAQLLVEAETQDITNPQAWLAAAAKSRKMGGSHANGSSRGNESAAERAARKAAEGDQRDRDAGLFGR